MVKKKETHTGTQNTGVNKNKKKPQVKSKEMMRQCFGWFVTSKHHMHVQSQQTSPPGIYTQNQWKWNEMKRNETKKKQPWEWQKERVNPATSNKKGWLRLRTLALYPV